MALFKLERYLGEEDDENEINENQQVLLLKQLKENARKKKQEKKEKKSSINENNGNNSSTSTLKRKIVGKIEENKSMKKKRRENDDDCPKITNTENEDFCENRDKDWILVEKHKKSKKKKKNDSELKDEIINDISDIGSISSKKHKKTKKKEKHKNEKEEIITENIEKVKKKFQNEIEKLDTKSENTEKHKKGKKTRKQDIEESSMSADNSEDKTCISKKRKKKKKKESEEKSEKETDEKTSKKQENKKNLDTNEICNNRIQDTEMEDNKEKLSSLNKNIKTVKDGPYQIGNFTVLGDYKVQPKAKVKYRLPAWLANPGVISSDLKETPVDQLSVLDSRLVNKLQENNITHFFPVQTTILPLLLNGRTEKSAYGKDGFPAQDICVSAPTGSGKTLAFVLPVIQTLLNRVVPRVRALVVLPVRDLAQQVYKVFQTYCKDTQLTVVLIAGLVSLPEEQNALVTKRINGYVSLADIVVATPGRLVDHINKTPGFDLSRLRFLVIDEADRMMEEIKQDWLELVEKTVLKEHGDSPYNLIDRTPPQPLTVDSCLLFKLSYQKLLFSATLSQDPEKLQGLNLFQPLLYTTLVRTKSEGSSDKEIKQTGGDFVGKYVTPPSLTELHVECRGDEKPLIVLHCLHNQKYRQILCFTNSVEATHRLYLLMKLFGGGIQVREFSSQLSGTARQKILDEFSTGKIDMIICTDAMARGMDINNVQYVILYDRPSHIETYIHRVGRTARAGKPGTAITILEEREVMNYKTMLRESGKQKFKKLKLNLNKLWSLKPMYNEALEKLPTIIKAEKKQHREVH